MKTIIFVFLLCVFLPLGGQHRTHYTPLPCVVRRWRAAVILPRLAIRLEIVRT